MTARFLPLFVGLLLVASRALAATAPLTDVVQMDVGGRHACVVTAAGGVQCWGDNTNGILGDGTTTPRAWAGDVTGLTAGISAVTTSRGWDAMNPDVAHTCALSATGTVRCWGDNRFGQLGIGTQTGFASTPAAAVPLGQPALAISAGWAHTCALLADHTVACWGYNGENQLGIDDFNRGPESTPVVAAGFTGIAQISAGPLDTCVLTLAGGVKCTSQADLGTASRPPPPHDVVGMTSGVASISNGGSRVHLCHSIVGFDPQAPICEKPLNFTTQGDAHLCATMVGGAIRCAGSNAAGQLGDGTTTSRAAAADVSGFGTGGMQVSVAGFLSAPVPFGNPPAGVDGAHSCAVTTGGTVKCWGREYCGLLGDGGTADCTPPGDIRTTPVGVTGLSNIRAVAAGGVFGCALSVTGTVSCWGVGYGATPLRVVTGTPPASTRPAYGTGAARLANISTRGNTFTGNDIMIAGFIVGGTVPKTVAITAAGPSLFTSGIRKFLATPALTLVRQSDGAIIATSDNWTGEPEASQVQDSDFAPAAASEAAIVITLAPGAYTALVTGADGGTGVSVTGVFEVDHPESPLLNISTRAFVDIGSDTLIAGFIIGGTDPQQVALVATGPSLASAGVIGTMADPVITLVRQSDGAVIASNDNWGDDPRASELRAKGFAPGNSLEAGMLVTLPPGAYTALLTEKGGRGGNAVIGVYSAP